MKNIVICCDGTGNEFGRNNTNVVETYLLADKDATQSALYDPGVGTGGWEYNEESGLLNAKSDQATGHGLQRNVEDAYRYLMAEYEDGDRLYLFGFSRGAFTARSLAGMLHKVGLLRPGYANLVEYASKIYNTRDNADIAEGFKGAFARGCPVHFIGVWDTVESLVMNAGKRFHDATLNPEVSVGCHAISIDERRKDFPALLWDEARVGPAQSITQVWFAGVHSDVGGWYDERGLANVSLQWMMAEAVHAGLKIDRNRLATRYVGNPHDEIHESYSGFWKFRGKRVREIPEGSKIHASALKRRDNPDNDYNPRNLPDDFVTVQTRPLPPG